MRYVMKVLLNACNANSGLGVLGRIRLRTHGMIHSLKYYRMLLKEKKKKGDPVIFNKMSEPGEHYVE